VVDWYKRERVARAAGLVAHEVGLPGVTVSLLVQRAAMARNTFYELFANRDEALLFAIELGTARLRKAIDDGLASRGPWERRTKAAIESLFDAVEDDPMMAELCLVHAPGLRDRAVPLDPDLVQTLAGILRPGRGDGPKPGPGPHTEEIVALGILTVVAERLRRGESSSLRVLAGELFTLALLLFRGVESVHGAGPGTSP
jgi:AcrR family transcriptional regulator